MQQCLMQHPGNNLFSLKCPPPIRLLKKVCPSRIVLWTTNQTI